MEKEGKYRRYDAEFKREAVHLVTEREQPVSKVAEDLGVHPSVIARWRREYLRHRNGSFPGKGNMTPEQEKLHQLERENVDLREERDILKKALSIFSRQGKRSTNL